MKYRKLPIVIEAIEFREDNIKQLVEFLEGGPLDLKSTVSQNKFENYKNIIIKNGLKIQTLEGEMTASLGDYIIIGIKGEIYPCKPDIFQETYKEAEANDDRPPHGGSSASNGF